MAAAMISCASLLLAGYWAAGIAHPALRAESMVAVAALGAAMVGGPSPRLLGPVATDGASRSVRRFGQLVIALCGLGLITGYRFEPRTDPIEQVTTGLPLLSAVLLAHILAVTSTTARRSPLRGRPIAVAGLAAMTGTVVCFASTAVLGTVPQSPSWTLVVVAGAGVFTALLVARHHSAGVAAVAALHAAAATGLLVVVVAIAALEFVPALVPDLSQHMLPSATAADRLKQSRRQGQDAFVAALLVGGLCAALAGTATVVQRRGPGPAGRRRPASL
jgi:hypothetical protein